MRRIIGIVAALVALTSSASAYAQTQFKLLVLAMPSKYHHEYIPGHARQPGASRTAPYLRNHLDQQRRTFDGDLSQYAAVMFLNTPSEELTPAQPSRFEAFAFRRQRDGGTPRRDHSPECLDVVREVGRPHHRRAPYAANRRSDGCRQRLSCDLWYS